MILSTHICPDAPTQEHFPVPFMDSPIDMELCNRMDVDEFMERIRKSKSQPLNVLTGGKHWHTVEADTEPMLQVIGEKLREKGYLQE